MPYIIVPVFAFYFLFKQIFRLKEIRIDDLLWQDLVPSCGRVLAGQVE